MPFAAAIKFKENGASKYFNPGGLEVEGDDFVWVKDPGAGGIERIGFVSCMEGRAQVQMGHLPRVLRFAEDAEIEQWYELKIEEREMLEVARERSRAHELPVKVSDLIFVSDKRQVIIQFTSDHRVDFRELVKDLAGHFKARIEMWQIGARKEAGLKDGYGVCGNPLCCGSWLKDFPSITMRYAKEQDIIQPPSKLSGPCGKLRCCLRYEHEMYLELADGVATRGCAGCSSDGKCGVVIDRNLLKRELTLKTEEGSYVSIPADDFQEDGKPRRVVPEAERPREVEPEGVSASTGPATIVNLEDEPEPAERPRERGPSRSGRRRDEPRGSSAAGSRPGREASGESGATPGSGRERRRGRGERPSGPRPPRRPRDGQSDSRSDRQRSGAGGEGPRRGAAASGGSGEAKAGPTREKFSSRPRSGDAGPSPGEGRSEGDGPKRRGRSRRGRRRGGAGRSGGGEGGKDNSGTSE